MNLDNKLTIVSLFFFFHYLCWPLLLPFHFLVCQCMLRCLFIVDFGHSSVLSRPVIVACFARSLSHPLFLPTFFAWDPFSYKPFFFTTRHDKSTVRLHHISTSHQSLRQEDKKLPPPLPKKPAGGVSGSLRADSIADGGAGGGGGERGGGSGGLVVPRLGGHTLPIREKSLDLGDRQRTEARRRLLQTKRTASFRQNSATESADSIEIYIPEAQTRL